MLPILGKKKRKKTDVAEINPEEILVAIDVGTRYIKAVLFKATSQSEITIVGYARRAQKYGAMRDAMIVNLQQVIEAVDSCVGRAIEVAEKSQGEIALPSKAVIGIAGELVKGVSILAGYEREDADQKISEVELDEVLLQVQEQAFAGAVEEIAKEVGMEPQQIEEIQSRIDRTEIDGVVVNNPLGFTGQEVSYRVFSTFAPRLHVNSLRELAESLGLEQSKVVVQPYAVARAIKEVQQNNAGAIIVDMGGGTTDVALIDKGGVLGTKMFAFGGDVLTKRLAEFYKLEMQTAEDLKLDYSDQKIAEKQSKEIHSLLEQDLKIWVEGLQIAIEELLEDEDGDISNLPPQMYLCGGGATLAEVREVCLQHPWTASLPFEKFPKINYLFPNQLQNVTDETRLLIDPSDVTPAAIARMLIDRGF
ncbi:MAG: cell division FtsA domain-containing protein [Candidatus Dojkabacteria bacterium]